MRLAPIATLACALLAALPFSSRAQDFPVKPVRLVVPFVPGGPLDVAGRLLAANLSQTWKQPVIVENKSGSSTLGPDFVAKSPPDGYTILIMSSSPLLTFPHLQNVPYDVLRDLVGVTQTTLLTYALLVNPSLNVRTLDELINEARKSPGRLNYSSAGNGSGQHLYMELIKSGAGMDLTHVPYKGAAPALQALLTGDVQAMVEVTATALPLVQSGKARAVLITGGRTIDQAPGAVPLDQRFPGLGIPTWHGIFAPGATPAPVLAKLSQDIVEALRNPALAERFRQLGLEPSGVTGDAFNQIIRSDFARWGELIRRNKLRPD